MLVSHRLIHAATNSNQPKHRLPEDGAPGEEMQTPEWMSAQVRVACGAIFEMMRPPRILDAEDEQVIPRISVENEDLAYHLLNVHENGHFDAADSFKFIAKHPDANPILTSWVRHFGELFNITCKQFQMSYEDTESRLQYFQYRLIEHVQHLRRIYEEHSGGVILNSATAWKSMDWADPHIVSEDNIDFLRQSVFLPHVVGHDRETALMLGADYHTRESLYVRLSPYGKTST